MVGTVAAKLRAWLQEVEPDASAQIEIVSQSAPDPDGGTSSHSELSLDLPRASQHTRLVVRFTCAVHGPTGERDSWRADIQGALPEEREALWEVFHPRADASRRFANHVEPTFVFNGERTTYPLR